MADSQLARIKQAEEVFKEFDAIVSDLRRELDSVEDPRVRRELLEAIDGLEAEARKVATALREWREDIH